MVLHFEKRLVQTKKAGLFGAFYKSIYQVSGNAGVMAEFEYELPNASFSYKESQYVIKRRGKFYAVTTHLLLKQDDADPVAGLKTDEEGWTFIKPFIQFREGKKYIFKELKKKQYGSSWFWNSGKGGYYEVCLKDEDNAIACEFKFEKAAKETMVASGIKYSAPEQYRNLRGTITLHEDNYILALAGCFFIEKMLEEEDKS